MNKQTIFTIVLVLAIGVTGYLWYGYLQKSPGESLNQNQGTQLSRIGEFKNIHVDTSLFQDPLFLSLTPPQIIPQPDVTPGRSNPFAPF